jgi:flagellar hook-associated protein 3 FlgL
MRIADKMNFDQVNATLTKNRTEMSELQNQAATQKRVTKPSDDPLAATRILATRTEITSGQQFMKSVSQAKNFLEYSEQSLGELTEIFTRAKELAISQSNDASADHRTRTVAGTEVTQLHDQLGQVANRKMGDRFLFSGFKTTTKPFDTMGRYQGDDGEIKIAIQKEGDVSMNMPGSRIFLGKNINGLTPAQIDAVKKNDERLVRETDAELDGSRVDDQLGGHIRGPASVDSSLGSKNISSSDGHKTDSDSPNPSLGVSRIDGINVFKVLQDLATSLNANDKEGVQDSLDSLDKALDQVVQARAQLGSRLSTLNGAMETLQKGRVEAKTLVSNLEDADTFELVTDINKTEATLKASLSTSGKLIQPSLLDFIK